MTEAHRGLRVLAVDDEKPARDELAYLLSRDERVAEVLTASDGAEALRLLDSVTVDALFVDIRMPGLDGLDLARVLRRFAEPPPVVFVTAYDSHGVEAFDLRAVDYLMKPVREQRLQEAVGRVVEARGVLPTTAVVDEVTDEQDPTIAVELGGVVRFIRRSEVCYVESHGDYARLVTDSGRHLIRVSLAHLEDEWASAGFVRIHRRWLVALAAIDEVRSDGGRMSLVVHGAVLPVSRRHTPALRDRLVRGARP